MFAIYFLSRFVLFVVHGLVKHRMTALNRRHVAIDSETLRYYATTPVAEDGTLSSRLKMARASAKLAALSERASAIETRYDWWGPSDARLTWLRGTVRRLSASPTLTYVAGVVTACEGWLIGIHAGDLLDGTIVGAQWVTSFWSGT